jgi:hypothetical protein
MSKINNLSINLLILRFFFVISNVNLFTIILFCHFKRYLPYQKFNMRKVF